jgi:DNA modification methylase
MKEKIIQVEEIPIDVEYNSTLEITSNNLGYFMHSFFKYPCKFIPLVPRWAILKYTQPGEFVLDPFAGSGTTLVEAVLLRRNALGAEFDKLSQLLCETKTRNLSSRQIQRLIEIKGALFAEPDQNYTFRPDLHNINHWFPQENVVGLAALKERIDGIYAKTKDRSIPNFLLVCFAAIIRKCSYADDTSPKPYVSTRIKKRPATVREAFLSVFNSSLKNIERYENHKLGRSTIISQDARDIRAPTYEGRVSLAITSPPYINAFDYVRSLRLENAWLGYYGDSNIMNVKRKQVGTEIIPSSVYSKELEKTGNKRLDLILNTISETDKKRAFVVLKFFEDMTKDIMVVKKLLRPNSHYVIVVGDSEIRRVNVPTHDILVDIAQQNGFKLDNIFSYIIKNRYLRIPRSGRGGLIKKDWVIDLVKTDG